MESSFQGTCLKGAENATEELEQEKKEKKRLTVKETKSLWGKHPAAKRRPRRGGAGRGSYRQQTSLDKF